MKQNVGDVAYDITNQDNIIKESIQNIVAKETKIMRDYVNLKTFRKSAPPVFFDELDKLLEERRIYLAYKMQSKQDQCSALIKLIEYINTLEAKDKKMQSESLLNKIKFLESEIFPYKELLL